MKIAVAGGTGFIGSRLIHGLTANGHEVIVISRTKREGVFHENVRFVSWDELRENTDVLEGSDVIVNLAGETINQLWTEKAKQRILQSRIGAAERIAAVVSRLGKKPYTVINSSGISAYGTSDSESYREESRTAADDFLSRVAADWEHAADSIPAARLVKLRTGVVLGHGGALPLMLLPYKLGFGGRLGSGRQWLSWIHIDDMVSIIHYCMENGSISGPINCTSPQPVTNDEFGRAVGRALNRPHWLPMPAPVFRLLLGEMSDLLLKGQKVLPGKLLESGFRFRYPTLDDALRNLLRRS
ncbi:TIGR01777 family oxidoreductase [Ferviditalea candida]|uniref:TIGR01777 family oxidoreductase n=1 Tax=Ferviditalea candida TaxID=3108399 RepID=A0ABU5ZFQ1_9BACL|nr:TIGR01777 family oxidoreductase [Paenibacillaceae bacterium T2]